MTLQGKLNVFGMFLLPVVATVAMLIGGGNAFGMAPPQGALISAFGMNLVPMLISGLVAGILLWRAGKNGGVARSLAIWPTIIPAVIGSLWYLYLAVVPDPQAPGYEYIGGPIMLLVGVLILSVVAIVGCLIAWFRRKPA